ncbi:MAG: hypothetical protein QM756_30780 [Polyangiaceae bacterium]
MFGWYIEVSRAQASKVPTSYRRKQTVATGERYTTPELDELADRILHAEERHRERELGLLKELVAQCGAQGRTHPHAGRAGRALGRGAAALAEVAHRHDYIRPSVDDSDALVLRDARHPVVERSARGRALRAERRRTLSDRRYAPVAPDRPEHGRQEHLLEASRAAHDPRADGQLRACAEPRASAPSTACCRASGRATTCRGARAPSWSRCARRPRNSAQRHVAARW